MFKNYRKVIDLHMSKAGPILITFGSDFPHFILFNGVFQEFPYQTYRELFFSMFHDDSTFHHYY